MLKAADIVFSAIISVRPDHTVQDAARLMLEHGVSALPVIEATGQLVGIVSESDLMRHVDAGTDHHRSWWLRSLMGPEGLAREYIRENARRIGDVMTRTVVTATPDTPVRKLADLLERNGIKHVPIVDNAKVIGIVSRAKPFCVLLLAAISRTFTTNSRLTTTCAKQCLPASTPSPGRGRR